MLCCSQVMSLQVIYLQYQYQKVLGEIFPLSAFPWLLLLPWHRWVMWHCHLSSLCPVSPSHPHSSGSDRHRHEKGTVLRSCRKWVPCFQKRADIEGKESAIPLQGLSTRGGGGTRTLLAILGSSVSPAYTAGPPLHLWKGFFSPWLVVLLSDHLNRKWRGHQTKGQTELHTFHRSAGKLGVSLTEGWDFQGLSIPSCDPFLLGPSLLYSDYERTFYLTSTGNPLFQLSKSQKTT